MKKRKRKKNMNHQFVGLMNSLFENNKKEINNSFLKLTLGINDKLLAQ